MNTATSQVPESAKQARKNATELVIGSGGAVENIKLNEPESPVLPPKPEQPPANGHDKDKPEAPMVSPTPNPVKKISQPATDQAPSVQTEEEVSNVIRVTAKDGMV